jgi:acetamidase/formamidase
MKRIPRANTSYLFDRRIEPAVVIQPGESIVVETEDSCSGRIRTPEDITPENLSKLAAEFDWFGPAGRSNPVTGPIFVHDAEPGDTLIVRINNIQCDTQGFTGFWPIPDRGMSDLFDSPRYKITPVINDQIIFNDHVRIPLKPMIGTIGTAPPLEIPSTGPAGTYGGNMDCPDVAPGSTVYLPVYVQGALLFLGDAHAVQGDGEVTGGGIEIRTDTALTIDRIKGSPSSMTWPRIETDDYLITVAAGKPLESALRTSLKEMIFWLEDEYNWDRNEAYLLLGQVGDAAPCQVVTSTYTMRFRMPKKYL